jgi:hypothetical protein
VDHILKEIWKQNISFLIWQVTRTSHPEECGIYIYNQFEKGKSIKNVMFITHVSP